MTVQQVIDMAAKGELANIAAKNDNDKILSYINLGIIELYKRFPLKVEEHIIELQDGVTTYDLPDNLMWITAAYGEVEDTKDTVKIEEIPVNEEDNPLSINTIGWSQVQIPVANTGSFVSIIYVAAPEYLTADNLAGKIPVPPQMIEALLHYVGYRAHAAMDGNIQAENSTHYTRFEASCKRIEERGMYTSDDLDMSPRYGSNIWV